MSFPNPSPVERGGIEYDVTGPFAARHLGPLTIYRCPDGGWFRVFGYGLWWTDLDRRRHGPLFTERNRLGTWRYSVTFGDRWKVRPLVPPKRGWR